MNTTTMTSNQKHLVPDCRKSFGHHSRPTTIMKAKPGEHPGEVVFEVKGVNGPLLETETSRPLAVPFRIKNILVPIDFSECSKKALQYAIPFAKLNGATVSLLYIVSPHYLAGEYGGVNFAPVEVEMRENGTKRLNALMADEVSPDIPAQTLVRTGTPAAEIVALARSLPADLIVLSTHGYTGLRHVLLGSVTEYVVRHAPCPVLVVRQREKEFLATARDDQ
jgi:nucleotide-binding universal stress UspA family protein